MEIIIPISYIKCALVTAAAKDVRYYLNGLAILPHKTGAILASVALVISATLCPVARSTMTHDIRPPKRLKARHCRRPRREKAPRGARYG